MEARVAGLYPLWVLLASATLFLMAFNALWADWSLNLVSVTSYGPFFPGTHALSNVAVLCATILLIRKSVKSGGRREFVHGALLGVSTMPLHEFVWIAYDYAITGGNTLATPFYMGLYGVILAVALLRAKKDERFQMLFIAAVIAAAYLPIGSIYIAPGSFDYNLAPILGWALASALWFVPLRWPRRES